MSHPFFESKKVSPRIFRKVSGQHNRQHLPYFLKPGSGRFLNEFPFNLVQRYFFMPGVKFLQSEATKSHFQTYIVRPLYHCNP